jgi:hypothetical protein
MKLKAVKPAKDSAAALARTRARQPQARGVRGQDLGDRRLQLLLGAKANAR